MVDFAVPHGKCPMAGGNARCRMRDDGETCSIFGGQAQCRHEIRFREQKMPETMGEERPRIYVSCLATYNGGSYHGVWIDATKSADDIQKCVDKMLSTSKEPYAEEWAIHDSENFHEIRIGEWESFEKVSETANALVEHGPAYSAFVKLFDEDEHGPEKFTDRFVGEYEGRVDFAQYWCEEYHPELLEQHLITIDYESTWNQLQIAQVCRGIRTPRGFFVFNY